ELAAATAFILKTIQRTTTSSMPNRKVVRCSDSIYERVEARAFVPAVCRNVEVAALVEEGLAERLQLPVLPRAHHPAPHRKPVRIQPRNSRHLPQLRGLVALAVRINLRMSFRHHRRERPIVSTGTHRWYFRRTILVLFTQVETVSSSH